jgi:hypothetical protein
MKRFGTMAVAAVLLTACAENPAGPAASELALAQEAQDLVSQDVAALHHDYVGWLARLIAAVRSSDDPEARTFLEQAHAYHDSAVAARRAGDFEAARHYFQLGFRAVLSAVIEVFPNAPQRTGELVDNVVARIETRLGDREAPRIRRILAHVKELRAEADAVDDPMTQLALNLRCVQILHRLVHHVRFVRPVDHDRVADGEMQEAPVDRP